MKHSRALIALAGLAAVTLAACNGGTPEPATQAPVATEPAKTPEAAKTQQAPKVAVVKADHRVVILGFDGVDPDWVDQWKDELPNLSALMVDGKAHRLGTTTPPQSPVAWSTFATSLNPGAHGIFDFVTRNPANYFPAVGTNTYKDPVYNAAGEVQAAGSATSPRKGTPFWETAAEHGITTKVLYVPYSYPANPLPNGNILPGLGVPDLRLTNSTCFVFGTDIDDAADKKNGAGVDLVPLKGTGPYTAEIEGPKGLGKGREKIPVELTVEGDLVKIKAGDASTEARVGEFSDWVTLHFSVTNHYTANAIVRFRPLSIGETVRVYMYPLMVDPEQPYVPLSEPPQFAVDLGKEYGTTKTIGWEHDTSALNSNEVPDAVFVQDRQQVWEKRVEVTLGELKKKDADLFISVFTDPDRAAHMFMRLTDKEFLTYDEALAREFGGFIKQTYLDMDKVVGQIQAELSPGDVLIVLSDHGFHSFKRGFNTNTWLLDNGYLALKPGAVRSGDNSLLNGATEIDWAKTKAYAYGTGQVYFNLKGREKDGIVEPTDVHALAEEIKAGMLTVKDGEHPVLSDVVITMDAWKNADPARVPDLQLAFAENYQSSRKTSLGGIPEGLFDDNDKKWSGDHAASDARDTEGFIATVGITAPADADIADVAPTVLTLLGVEVPKAYEGKVWQAIGGQAPADQAAGE